MNVKGVDRTGPATPDLVITHITFHRLKAKKKYCLQKGAVSILCQITKCVTFVDIFGRVFKIYKHQL